MEHYPHAAVFVNYHGFSTNSVHCLHAGDLKPSTTEEVLVNLFNKYGPIYKVVIKEKNGRQQFNRVMIRPTNCLYSILL